MIPQRINKKTLSSVANKLIWVQKCVPVSDHEGGFNNNWVNRTTEQIWAEISPIQARQRDIYRSKDVEATHIVKINGYEEIEEYDRIRYGTRIFDVLTIENIQEDDFTKVVTCKEDRKGEQNVLY